MKSVDRYVAYVSSYTMGSKENYGIHIYNVDMENGYLQEKKQVSISNSSYISVSHNRRFLYSITDMGVESYRIEAGGDLTPLNLQSINGMRGSYLSTDYTDSWLFVAGYHDGKVTVLKLNPDGSVGPVTDEIFHKGLGSVVERNFRPHVQCVKMTRDNRFLCAADLGMDHVVIYSFDPEKGKLKQADIIHCDLESAPRHLKFSEDGKFLYIVCEQKCSIEVYSYSYRNGNPEFERIQSISTLNKYHTESCAASALHLSEDCRYLISSNAGDNSAVMFYMNRETGELTRSFCLPISGEYPKDAALFPDNRHLVSINHESNDMTFFNVDIEKGLIILHGKRIRIDRPNCIIFHRIRGES